MKTSHENITRLAVNARLGLAVNARLGMFQLSAVTTVCSRLKTIAKHSLQVSAEEVSRGSW